MDGDGSSAREGGKSARSRGSNQSPTLAINAVAATRNLLNKWLKRCVLVYVSLCACVCVSAFVPLFIATLPEASTSQPRYRVHCAST